MQGGHRTGVELDSITARIAKKLYPDATIFAKGFEETPLPDNYFDAVVGNVPFGDYAVHDPAMKRQLTRAIHDYFFAKSLEKVRPGGVMALITSRYTMDKQNDTIPASGRTCRPARRDPVAEHSVQEQCGHGSHHRYSVSSQANARSAARGPCLAWA
jgi:tRNA G10  N-methylase Trm11